MYDQYSIRSQESTMMKLALYLLPACTAMLLAILIVPILAVEKTSNNNYIDEFMSKNLMKKNYYFEKVLQNALLTDLFETHNPEEIPALIVDYVNMIRNNVVLHDDFVEPRTSKRGNLKIEKKVDDSDDYDIPDTPCTCEQKSRVPVFLGSEYFPSVVDTRNCNEKICPAPYKCQERLHNITVLKRKRSISRIYETSQEELPEDLARWWVAVKTPVTVGCLCVRDYTELN